MSSIERIVQSFLGSWPGTFSWRTRPVGFIRTPPLHLETAQRSEAAELQPAANKLDPTLHGVIVVHTSWESVRDTLKTHQLCTAVLPANDGSCLRIRKPQLRPQMPIIVMSGLTVHTDSQISNPLEMAMKLGANHSMGKPFGLHELLNLVRLCLSKPPANG